MDSDFALALVAGTLSVIIGLVVLGQVPQRFRGSARSSGLERPLQPMTFLFRDKQLVDATPPARAFLDLLPGDSEWQRLTSWFATHMPGVPTDPICELAETGRVDIALRPAAGRAMIRATLEEVDRGLVRIYLSDPSSDDAGTVVDSLTLAAMEEELELLRTTMDSSPMLAWREDADGHITWANSAYLKTAEVQAAGGSLWPLPRLVGPSMRTNSACGPERTRLGEGDQIRWFECYRHQGNTETVAIALPADAAVRAERSLREFVQTLTKTFADLPIGLAIFDRERHLQLFNPALIDLTGLSVGFLTARPTLFAFLDRLREAHMVPEPKNYRSWRQQMSTLEKSAASGHHVETWSLPGGQTYRVSGRPHPGGAVAFLFEDITSEISLTRKFRAELSLSREILDSMEDAIAVFSGNGSLLLTNGAYRKLWGDLDAPNLASHIGHWRMTVGDGPGFNLLKEALTGHRLGARSSLEGAMAGPAGQLLAWSLKGMTAGSVMVSFKTSTSRHAVDEARSQPPRVADARGDAGVSTAAIG